jgi:hypothetical protein
MTSRVPLPYEEDALEKNAADVFRRISVSQ